MKITSLLRDVCEGYRLAEPEAAQLLKTKGREIFPILAAADRLREERAGPAVTYVRNQNIHITNICKNLCGFCGFGRRAGDEGAYCDDHGTIRKKVTLARERKVTEICLLSGVHPDFSAETYCELLAVIRKEAPDVHIHAFSPDEISYAAGMSEISPGEVLAGMRQAGLNSLQGTAAEILVDEVRQVICPQKLDSASWEAIIREAHRMGIPTTASILYGTCERIEDRVRHLTILRKIQDDTAGFTELVPLSYVYQNTPLYRSGHAAPGATGREDLLLIAVSRLFLDNFANIQVSWGKLGIKLSQLALLSGGNDLAGTLFSDDVTGNAGIADAGFLDPAVMERIAGDIGRPLVERRTDYSLVRPCSFVNE
jgi:FO synthase subunit 2